MIQKQHLQTMIDAQVNGESIRQALTPGQSWTDNVIVPLVQNILGGAATAGLLAISYTAYTGATPGNSVLLWCYLAGGALTCLATLTRFFADDLGLLVRAYRVGQRSRDGQIAALELELRTATDAMTASEADGMMVSATRKHLEFYERARKDAAKLIEVHFNGDSIARTAMGARGLGQRDWERATRLLKASGVMNGDGSIIVRNPSQALRLIDVRMKEDAGRGDSYTPSWK